MLYLRSRGTYYTHFNGDALAGEPFERVWIDIDPSLGIQVKDDCSSEDTRCNGPIRWASGNRLSELHFLILRKVGNRDFKGLGSSLIGFIIS